jgi:hypothetical protein
MCGGQNLCAATSCVTGFTLSGGTCVPTSTWTITDVGTVDPRGGAALSISPTSDKVYVAYMKASDTNPADDQATFWNPDLGVLPVTGAIWPIQDFAVSSEDNPVVVGFSTGSFPAAVFGVLMPSLHDQWVFLDQDLNLNSTISLCLDAYGVEDTEASFQSQSPNEPLYLGSSSNQSDDAFSSDSVTNVMIACLPSGGAVMALSLSAGGFRLVEGSPANWTLEAPEPTESLAGITVRSTDSMPVIALTNFGGPTPKIDLQFGNDPPSTIWNESPDYGMSVITWRGNTHLVFANDSGVKYLYQAGGNGPWVTETIAPSGNIVPRSIGVNGNGSVHVIYYTDDGVLHYANRP